MLRKLLHRPIAVYTSLLVLMLAGILAIRHLPVSLLPAIDVPQIVVQVNHPNTPADMMEEEIVGPIRKNLLTLGHIREVESQCTHHRGLIYLTYEHGTAMALAFIEVNEKLDRLMGLLPKHIQRPRVMRINTSDIPIIRLQVNPKAGTDYQALSDLTQYVLKKRIEQIDGVSLVDMNGQQESLISINPNMAQLEGLGITPSAIADAFTAANQNLGSLSVKDGHYEYFVRLNQPLKSEVDVARLRVPTGNGQAVPLHQIAAVRQEAARPLGAHLYNGRPGLSLLIHKQPLARMTSLIPEIRQLVQLFEADYPGLEFQLNQDQSFLLEASIRNLSQALLLGGLLAIVVLFLFFANARLSLLIGLSIPVSLLLTFVCFYGFDISLNIISLSGLALGFGMLIDNSIIVLDSIVRKRRDGIDSIESCVAGTKAIFAPVMSQFFTTVAVYAPLVMLSGLAGALVYEQALALSISLMISLLIAFVLLPSLFHLLFGREAVFQEQDTRFFRAIAGGYHSLIHVAFRHKVPFFTLLCLLAMSGWWLSQQLAINALPELDKKEVLLNLDWNEAIGVEENLYRFQQLDQMTKKYAPVREADLGISQYLFQQEEQSVQQLSAYFDCIDQTNRKQLEASITDWLATYYPKAIWTFSDAPNAFTQLFANKNPYLELRFRPMNEAADEAFQRAGMLLQTMPASGWKKDESFAREEMISLRIHQEKLLLYGLSMHTIRQHLQRLFGQYTIAELKQFGQAKAVRFKSDHNDLQSGLKTLVKNNKGDFYPLSEFIQPEREEAYKWIKADRQGPYKSIFFSNTKIPIDQIQQQFSQKANQEGLGLSFAGTYFDNQQNLSQLIRIFMLSLLLLYFILCLQFENFIHPFLVILTMPLGLIGSFLLLYLSGTALDIMAGIGFIVVLGIIVDDPILKIEMINRLRKTYEEQGLSNRQALLQSIQQAGSICLKPVIMTSLTTSLALLPILFTPGIGSALQRPLAYVVIGGLLIGTLLNLVFIPLAYWMISRTVS